MLKYRIEGGRVLLTMHVVSELSARTGQPMATVEASLDFGLPAMELTTTDLQVPDLVLDDLLPNGHILSPAFLTLQDEERGMVGFVTVVRIRNGGSGQSRVGIDLLRQWFVAIDLRDSLVVIQPHDPDEAGSGSI